MGNLTTPKRVQKLQMALHAKAKAEADYRFYALYDKISREDILAHAYAQCRSNKSLPLRRQGARRGSTVLRRPHDHCRGLCARQRTPRPTVRRRRHQDLMR